MTEVASAIGNEEEEAVAPGESRRVLELTHAEAREFFLRPECYCSLDLPSYFDFGPMLAEISSQLEATPLTDNQRRRARDVEDACHTISHNKDGQHAWRPFQLVHPVLYVDLVHRMTDETTWNEIQKRFEVFAAAAHIDCASIPVVLDKEDARPQDNRAEQITTWWRKVEQKSIELALEYDLLYTTDIVDCYGAIYTHSIAWALHDKAVVKRKENRKNQSFIGNALDTRIQDARHGQTNGIPQGSVVSDFIAEMVLGYADTLIADLIAAHAPKIGDHYILRYRDDYRVFVNSSADGDAIIKIVMEVLASLGMRLNPQKTTHSSDVIGHAVKEDKIAWLERQGGRSRFQKQLLLIHRHAREYPNSSSVTKALDYFYKRVQGLKRITDPIDPLVSIVTDIGVRNPKTYPIAAAVLSVLIGSLEQPEERYRLIEKVRNRFRRIPNSSYLEVWLQRISYPLVRDSLYEVFEQLEYEAPLCQAVGDAKFELWNSDWLDNGPLKRACAGADIIDRSVLGDMTPVIPASEVELFTGEMYP